MRTQSLRGALIACNRPVLFSMDALLTLIMISLEIRPVGLHILRFSRVSECLLIILSTKKAKASKLSELYGLVWGEHVMFWMGNEGWPVYASSWAVSVCVRICGVLWWVSCVCWFRRRHSFSSLPHFHTRVHSYTHTDTLFSITGEHTQRRRGGRICVCFSLHEWINEFIFVVLPRCLWRVCKVWLKNLSLKECLMVLLFRSRSLTP